MSLGLEAAKHVICHWAVATREHRHRALAFREFINTECVRRLAAKRINQRMRNLIAATVNPCAQSILTLSEAA